MLPYLVQTAHHITDQFLRDWQSQPYRWDYELDVQIELASRLSAFCRLIGQDTVAGHYPEHLVPGYPAPQQWPRIVCEAKITYRYSDGAIYTCRPDIVIWDDIPDPRHPPIESQWPILWACEIKYHAEEPDDWDSEKLTYLSEQGQVQYGCWITMLRSIAPSGMGITWDQELRNERIWLCKAQLPATA